MNDGLKSHFIRSVKADSGMVYAGTYGQGVFRSSDKGGTWQEANSHLWHRDVTALMINEDGDLVAGTAGGGIFRSNDKGQSWYSGNGLLSNKYITCFVMNSVGDIYAGTYGGGVNISTNGGSFWSPYKNDDLSLEYPEKITCLTCYSDAQPVVGTCDFGIFRYDDNPGWYQWRHGISNNASILKNGVHALAKAASGVIYASIPREGFFKSTDGGLSWWEIYNRDEKGITSITSYKDGIMAAASSLGGVYLSNDCGSTWSAAGMEGKLVSAIAFDSTGNLYAGAFAGLFQSTDLGKSWSMFGRLGKTVASGTMDTAINSIAINAKGHFFVGISLITPTGGEPKVLRSTDFGNSWTDLGGMPAKYNGTKVMKISPGGDVFAIGDRGLVRSTDNGDSWQVVIHDSTHPNSVAFNSSGHVFAATDSGLYRSTDNGTGWTRYTFGWKYPQVDYVAITQKNHIYVTSRLIGAIICSSDLGATWDTVDLGFAQSQKRSVLMSSDRYLFLSNTSLYRTVDPSDLSAPPLRSPANNSKGVSINPTLTWDSVPRAELYEVQLSKYVEFSVIEEDVITGGNSYQLQLPLTYSSYYSWRVRAKTNSSLGPWRSSEFVTIIKPTKLISPENESKSHPANIKFTWRKVEDTGTYLIQVARDIEFTSLVVNKEVEDTSFSFTPFDLNSRYYWRVQCRVQGGASDWSETWSFTTKLRQVALRKPDNGSYGLPLATVFEWSPADSASGYYIQIAKDKDFSYIFFEGRTDFDSIHTFSLSQYFTTYFWRIKPFNNYGEGDWSTAWKYTTVIQPAGLVSPTDSSYDNPLSVDLKWMSYDKATAYHVQVSADPEFKSIAFEDSTLKVLTMNISPLDNNYTTYYWRARLKVNQYKGLWSEPWQFTTAMGRPVLSLPASDTKDYDISPVVLKWLPLKGADIYRLQLSKDVHFALLQLDVDSIKTTSFSLPRLDHSTTYYWRVMGKNEHSISLWSDIWNFRTKEGSSVVDTDDNDDLLAGIYPNPFSSSINIKLFMPGIENARLTIYDQKGSLVKEFNINPSQQPEITWQTADLAAGDYILFIEAGSRRIIRKIVRVK
jgi:photosystem II stability/assembly factor-like uncharacterized protein